MQGETTLRPVAGSLSTPLAGGGDTPSPDQPRPSGWYRRGQEKVQELNEGKAQAGSQVPLAIANSSTDWWAALAAARTAYRAHLELTLEQARESREAQPPDVDALA